jgi:phosphohistidine phosphatase
MQLFVIRHGIAEDAEPGQDDAQRALTKDGKKKQRAVARGMRELGWKLDAVITSPWRRAVQTAALVAKRDPIVTALLTQSPRSDLLGLINHAGERVGVVGHEPWLGELVAWLVFGDTRHGDVFEIKKSAVVLLEGEGVPGGMTLHALLPPRVLGKLA